MRLKNSWYYLLGVGLLPLVLLALNDSWVFPPPSWIDPWIYSGYHMHLHRLLADLPWAYYGTRVPWTVLGRIVHHFAGPLASLEILALLLFYASAFSLYFVSIRLFKSAAAGFAAVCLLGTNSWFLLAIGWNYVDGPQLACIFVSLAALTEAATGRFWRIASVMFGAVTAAILAIYIENLILLPVYAIMFVLLCEPARRPRLLIATGFSLAGFVAGVVAMSLINHAAGGAFDFWTPTFALLGSLTPSGTKDAYFVPWSLWLPAAGWLLVPGSIFLASLFFIAERRDELPSLFWLRRSDTEGSIERAQLAAAIVCVVTTIGFVLMQFDHWVVLSMFFRANTLLPFAYFALAGFIAIYLKRLTSGAQLMVTSGLTAVCLLPFILGMLGLVHTQVHGGPSSTSSNLRTAMASLGAPIEAGCTAVGVASLIWMMLLRSWVPLLLFSILSTFVSIGSMSIYPVIDKTHHANLEDRSLATFDAADIIDHHGDPVHLWWNETGPDRDIFVSLGSMYLQPSPTRMNPGERVALISPSPRWLNAAHAELSHSHLTLVNEVHSTVHQGGVSFDLSFGDIVTDPASFSAQALPLTLMKRSVATSIDSEVVTPATPWAYAAVLTIPNSVKDLSRVQTFAEITFRVVAGSIGVGVTTLDGRSWTERKFFSASPETRAVYLAIPSLHNAGDIVVCNGGSNTPSVAMVQSIRIVYLRQDHTLVDVARRGSSEDKSVATLDAASIIDRQRDPVHLWWSPKEPDRGVFGSLGSMYLQPKPVAFVPGDRVAVLASTPHWLDAATTELRNSHLELENATHVTVHEGSVSFGMLFGDVATDPSAFSARTLALTSMRRSVAVSNESEVVTPPQPWAYGGALTIPDTLKHIASPEVFAEVTLRVASGSIGVGVTTSDGLAWINRQFLSPSSKARTLYLPIPSLGSAGEIVICNGGLNTSSVAAVQSVKLVYLRRT